MDFVGRFVAAINDLVAGARLAPLWWRVGIEQTVARYRRTLLGPFWLASSTLATAFSLALVFGSIFHSNLNDSFPFIMSGVVSWSITGGMLLEGSLIFFSGSGIMQVQKLPVSFHAFLQIDRMMINFAHQIVAFWVVMLLMRIFPVPHWELLISLPLVTAIAILFGIPIGMVSIRYRDVNYMISFIAQALFMLTPVFWRKGQMSSKLVWIANYNPFAHLLEIVRQPLLGHPAPLSDWIASFGFLGFSAVLAVLCLTLYRRRIVFWL
jgi:ABC-type polysaccharide/polyol phosphate export permease